MAKKIKAYDNAEFLNSKNARALRILAEYLEPKSRFEEHGVEDTIVFFGSARFKEGSRWYEAARQLAFKLTEWSKTLPSTFTLPVPFQNARVLSRYRSFHSAQPGGNPPT